MKFGFLLYPGVEPIDLAAIGVVSMGRRLMPQLSYVCVAATLELQTFSNGLRVAPDVDYAGCPPLDVLIVPGGPGWEAASADPALLGFLRERAPHTTLASICTGAMILAAAGLLDGRRATTKSEVVPPEVSPLARLAQEHPAVQAVPALVVDTGPVVTGGGVSLCIDTVLHLIATRVDAHLAVELARILEYQDAAQANRRRLLTLLDATPA